MSRHELEQRRLENREAVRALGLEPYGGRVDGLVSLAAARERYDPGADADTQQRAKEPGFVDRRPVVRTAGRVVLHRDNGRLIWMNLRDDTGDLQVAVSQRDCDEASFQVARLTDLGDIVWCEGPLGRTRTGEITVWACQLRPAGKCLAPPPEKHAGLQDPELRFRRRYVDMWVNPETTRVFQARCRIVAAVRRELDRRGFVEVETPMLQPLPGGAAARPFVTRMNALDMALFLRVAPELYLKRLLVGGMPRVYEINRSFRNEGLDRQHNPEFTMLEAYQTFADADEIMDLTESLVREAAREVAGAAADTGAAAGALALPFGDVRIDYAPRFRRVPYADLFEKALGFAMDDEARVRRAAGERGLEHAGRDLVLVANDLFELAAEKSLDPAVPTFVTHYPASLSPLTRPHAGNPALADRADLFIGGMELSPNYTELNDPDVQGAKFREQLAGLPGDEGTFRTFDEDFIEALKVGMPPAGGMGLGIDRLTMLLTDQRSIRDVILFPLMRPRGQ
jgi:lysyl-tRNA synthetase class 2